MMQVQFRFAGDGLWRSFLAPAPLQAAWTLARAAKALHQPQAVQIQPSKAAAPSVDIRA
jgi:hypothetical protein